MAPNHHPTYSDFEELPMTHVTRAHDLPRDQAYTSVFFCYVIHTTMGIAVPITPKGAAPTNRHGEANL